MGLFDRFKKKKEEEIHVEYVSETIEEEQEEEENLLPEDFETTISFGGLENGKEIVDRLDFDLDHGYYRHNEEPENIYRISMIFGYNLLISTPGNKKLTNDFDDIDSEDILENVFISVSGRDNFSPYPLTATFFDPYLSSKEIDPNEALEKAKEFVEFLEERGIQKI
ncbi:MAG: hypothetical protein KBT48_05070 [Firmicutes bacterium]|nr:hypothetical protein [Bacillota bacterium]